MSPEDAELLTWLQHWFQRHADGNWEHGGGISIATLDNPGWRLTVELAGTELEGAVLERSICERSADDWVHWSADGATFHAVGGPANLGEMFGYFRDFAGDNGAARPATVEPPDADGESGSASP